MYTVTRSRKKQSSGIRPGLLDSPKAYFVADVLEILALFRSNKPLNPGLRPGQKKPSLRGSCMVSFGAINHYRAISF